MADSIQPLLNAGVNRNYISPTVIDLVRFMVGEQGNANVNLKRGLDPGVLGNYNSRTQRVNIKPHYDNEVILETLAHELSHSTESNRNADERTRAKNEPYYPLGSIGSDYENEFFRDMLPEMPKREQQAYIKRMTDRARELDLPSASTGNFNEIEANAIAARTMNELGRPSRDSKQVDEFMKEFPEFQEWVNSDLAGKYRNSPRMTEFIRQPSMVEQLLAVIFK